MKNSLIALLAIATAASATLAMAAQGTHDTGLHRILTIAVPGNPLKSFDISAVSAAQDVYGFSDRSNHSVDLFNAKTNRFIGHVNGFSHGGPNGLVAVGNDQFWAGDGGSKLRVVNISTRKIVDTVDTGGKQRVDEIAYDPRQQVIIAANNDDTPPFITFVSTAPRHRILGKLTFPQATSGLEQPVWNPQDGLIYLSVPELNHQKADGGVAIINPSTHKLEYMIHVNKCVPAGLALGPHDQLLVGCSDDAVAAGFAPKSLIVSMRTRKVVADIPQVGGSDEVWYDPGARRYYLAAVANTGGPVLGVINAANGIWLGNLPTGAEAHSVAADSHSGKVFVPVAANDKIEGCDNGCVEVFGRK
ncbi:MAG: cytochrome C nitrite reductase [Rhodanobacteraceae bacterium]